jgi:hypothetical protein
MACVPSDGWFGGIFYLRIIVPKKYVKKNIP